MNPALYEGMHVERNKSKPKSVPLGTVYIVTPHFNVAISALTKIKNAVRHGAYLTTGCSKILCRRE